LRSYNSLFYRKKIGDGVKFCDEALEKDLKVSEGFDMSQPASESDDDHKKRIWAEVSKDASNA
jgi:hypothetical protein